MMDADGVNPTRLTDNVGFSGVFALVARRHQARLRERRRRGA